MAQTDKLLNMVDGASAIIGEATAVVVIGRNISFPEQQTIGIKEQLRGRVGLKRMTREEAEAVRLAGTIIR